jgi:hypothetical protein
MNRATAAFAVMLTGVTAVTSAAAQGLSLNTASFKEALLAQPPPTRSSLRAVDTLVGVRAVSSGAFEMRNIRLGLGTTDKAVELCFKAISRDGRYTASARFNRAPGKESHAAVDIPTKFGDALKAYAVGDMSVQGFVAPDCALSKATELMVTANGEPKGGVEDIIVQVNAPSSRVRAQLMNRDKPLSDPVLCESVPDGPRTGFTAECRLKAAAGLLTLVLTETTSTGFGQRSTYPLRVLGADRK